MPAVSPGGARPGQRVVLVAAYAAGGAIGRHGQIPWHLPDDFAHFKATTLGHTLVMGRATYDSIGRPLPGRTTLVVTRDPAWSAGEYADGVLVAHSFEEALALAAELPGDVMVAGGAQIYALALPHATHQVLTEVALEVPDADTFYPEFDRSAWVETASSDGEGSTIRWLERLRGRRGGSGDRAAGGIVIDPGHAEPPYEQIKRQLSAAVASGDLGPGDKLPTVRRLATELGLAPNTVARAYRELEAAGVVDTRGRAGTFVSGDGAGRAAREAAAEFADRARALGLSAADALALVRRALDLPRS